MLCVSAEHPKLHTGRHLEIIYYGTENSSRSNDSQSPYVGCYKSDCGVLEVFYCESVEMTWIATFTDDIVIDISDENPTTVCNVLTAAVTSLANWLHEIGLLLNSQKTQLLFMKPCTSPDFNPKVYCGADLLTVTASANYLGVVVDSDLSWDYHIAHIGRKTARTIGQL